MEVKYFPGFAVFNFGRPDPLFVCLHSGSIFGRIYRGDIGADLITFRLAEKFKSRSVISFIPRGRYVGVDFNRIPPSLKLAKKMFPFFKRENFEMMDKFERKFAFIAKNEKEYDEKKYIYDLFWSTVKSLCTTHTLLSFIHTQSTALRNMPSLIDVCSITGKGGKTIKKAIEKVNSRYENKFQELSKDYTNFAIFSAKYYWSSIIRMKYGKIDTNLLEGDDKKNWEKTLNRAREINPKAFNILKNKGGLESLIEAIKLCSISPKITFELNFKGSQSYGTKKILKETKSIGIQFECSSFLTETYPDLAVELISNLIKEFGFA